MGLLKETYRKQCDAPQALIEPRRRNCEVWDLQYRLRKVLFKALPAGTAAHKIDLVRVALELFLTPTRGHALVSNC